MHIDADVRVYNRASWLCQRRRRPQWGLGASREEAGAVIVVCVSCFASDSNEKGGNDMAES